MKKIILIIIFLIAGLFAGKVVIGTSDCDFLTILFHVQQNYNKYKDLFESKGITQETILAQIKKESNFDKFKLSDKNAVGLMQVLPTTAKIYEKNIDIYDLFDIDKNIKVGTSHLAWLCKHYETKQEILQRYFWGNKKQLTENYFRSITNLENLIKKGE